MGYAVFHAVLYFLAVISTLETVLCQYTEKQRPFWVLAHMMNSIDQIDEAFELGANSIESDVKFTADGIPEKLYHGWLCDCFRWCSYTDDFMKYLSHIRDIGTPGSPLYKENAVLAYMDQKLGGVDPEKLSKSGWEIGKRILGTFFHYGTSEPRMRLVMGIPSLNHTAWFIGFFEAFKGHEDILDKYIGYDFSSGEDFDTIGDVVKQVGVRNIWMSRGDVNCFPRTDTEIRAAIDYRDQDGGSYIGKAYSWTIDCSYRIRNDLRLTVDAMITNQVTRVLEILKEDEFSGHFQLATFDDDPWLTIRGNGAISAKCQLGHCMKDCNWLGYQWCVTETSCSDNEAACWVPGNCSSTCLPKFKSFTFLCP